MGKIAKMKEKMSLNRILEISVPAIIVFAVSWGIYTTKSNANAEKIAELENKYQTVLEMKGDILVIKNDISYIKVAVEKLSDK